MWTTNRREEGALYVLLHDRAESPAEIRTAILDGRRPTDILAERQDGLLDPVVDPTSSGQSEIERLRQQGMHVMTPFTAAYPEHLREVHNAPLILFGLGTVLDDSRSVAIVGSRAASDHALQLSADLAVELGMRGVGVVSGLARGIDTAAHTAAIERGCRTVAVVGNGVDRTYPPENAGLQQEIIRDGLVLSQFWPGSSPTRQSFPMRNVTMSAYAGMTIIVEAGERSGTKHQANAAVRHGRPLIISSQVTRSTTWGRRLIARGVAREFKNCEQAVSLALSALRRSQERLQLWD